MSTAIMSPTVSGRFVSQPPPVPASFHLGIDPYCDGMSDDNEDINSLMRSVFSKLDFSALDFTENTVPNTLASDPYNTPQTPIQSKNTKPFTVYTSVQPLTLPTLTNTISNISDADGGVNPITLPTLTSTTSNVADGGVIPPKQYVPPATLIGKPNYVYSRYQAHGSTVVSYSDGAVSAGQKALISPDEVFKRYKNRFISTNPIKATTFMACKLAREAFFGDSVLAKSTITGKSGHSQLDTTKLDHLFSVLHSRMHNDLTEETFNEKLRSECLESIAQTCKRARKKRKMRLKIRTLNLIQSHN